MDGWQFEYKYKAPRLYRYMCMTGCLRLATENALSAHLRGKVLCMYELIVGKCLSNTLNEGLQHSFFIPTFVSQKR